MTDAPTKIQQFVPLTVGMQVRIATYSRRCTIYSIDVCGYIHASTARLVWPRHWMTHTAMMGEFVSVRYRGEWWWVNRVAPYTVIDKAIYLLLSEIVRYDGPELPE